MPDVFANERSDDAARKREKSVRAQQAAATNNERRSRTAMVGAIALLSAGLGWTVYSNGQLAGKLATRDVVYGMVQANGELVSSTHYAELPPAARQETAIQNALWTFVQAYDCYGSSSPVRQYYILQAMADQDIGIQIKHKFDILNKNAPQHVYGEKGATVQCELVDPPTPIGDMANHIYMFRFRRWEESSRVPGAPDPANAPFYTATVRFRTGVYPQDDNRRAWLDPVTFNAPGVQVIEYPGAKPTNVNTRG
jgi:hypothetical protein